MVMPNKLDPCWQHMLTVEPAPNMTGLATKMTLARLRRDVKQQPSMLASAIDEIHAFFSKNEFAQRELSLV
jgi:hypothetical protein